MAERRGRNDVGQGANVVHRHLDRPRIHLHDDKLCRDDDSRSDILGRPRNDSGRAGAFQLPALPNRVSRAVSGAGRAGLAERPSKTRQKKFNRYSLAKWVGQGIRRAETLRYNFVVLDFSCRLLLFGRNPRAREAHSNDGSRRFRSRHGDRCGKLAHEDGDIVGPVLPLNMRRNLIVLHAYPVVGDGQLDLIVALFHAYHDTPCSLPIHSPEAPIARHDPYRSPTLRRRSLF